MSFVLLQIFSISPTYAEGTADPIVVGVVHSDAYAPAESKKRSFEMAVKAKNEAGGVKGRPLKLVFADNGLKTGGTIGYQHGKEKQAVKSLAEQGAVMLLGGYSSANTIHTAFFAEALDVPLLVTTAADNQITQRGFENVYRLNPPAREYAAGVEEMLTKKIKPTTMAVVYEASRYGTDTAARMLSFCRENGIEVTKIIPYQKDRVNAAYLEKRLRRIQDDQPDVIFMVSYLKDAAMIVEVLRELNIGSLLIGAGGGFTDARFIEKLGGAADGVMTAALWSQELPYPGARDYHDKYVALYNEAPDYHGAEAYAAIVVAADALERADSLKAEAIRKSLDETDLETPFGKVRFRSYAKFERQNSTPTVVLGVADSKFQFVWPENIATAGLSAP